jgi:hypothetical protein
MEVFFIEFLWKNPFWKVPFEFVVAFAILEIWEDQKSYFNDTPYMYMYVNGWNIFCQNLDLIEHILYAFIIITFGNLLILLQCTTVP